MSLNKCPICEDRKNEFANCGFYDPENSSDAIRRRERAIQKYRKHQAYRLMTKRIAGAAAILLVFLAIVFLSGCAINRDNAAHYVQERGYSNVKVSPRAKYSPLRCACMMAGTFGRPFTAIDNDGNKVSGIVCSTQGSPFSCISWDK